VKPDDTGTTVDADADTDPGIFDQTNSLACDADRVALGTAIETFIALEGRPPADETELVGLYIREPSVMFDIATDGTLVPAPGSVCT
jgi:hypothetical protein